MSAADFKPYSPASKNPEMTLKAVVLGVLFGVLFACRHYLGLKSTHGLGVHPRRGLVHRGVCDSAPPFSKTISKPASAGESIAAGLTFTSGLIMLGFDLQYGKTMLPLIGGLIILLIPLRACSSCKIMANSLIPKAGCADVLIAERPAAALRAWCSRA